MNPVVDIHRWIAVRDDEAQFVSEVDLTAWTFEHQASVLVTRKLILHAGYIEGLRSKRTIRGERLQSRVHDSLAIGAMDNCCQNRKGRSEIIVNGATLSADAAIFNIHEYVGTRLQFRYAFDIRIDVIGSRAGPRQDLHPVSISRKHLARSKGPGQCCSGACAAILETYDVGSMARVGAQPFQLEVFCAPDAFREFQRWFSGLDSRTVLADVEINQHSDRNPGPLRRTLKILDVGSIVHHHHRVRRLRHDLN